MGWNGEGRGAEGHGWQNGRFSVYMYNARVFGLALGVHEVFGGTPLMSLLDAMNLIRTVRFVLSC
jgi:hypothetical protein